jgi:DNA-binding MarR family transcriptional regulator
MILVYKKKTISKAKRQPKSPKQMERHMKGVANHRRIEILFLVSSQKGITVDEIAKRLNVNFKTLSEHVRRLVQAGLIRKEYRGRTVTHELSPYGKIIYNFLKTFSHS